MSELKIFGNSTPKISVAESYSVNELFSSAIPTRNFGGSKPDSFEYPVEWTVHVLENGRWRKTKENDKTGNTVFYTFLQKSLDRKGIRIMVQKGGQRARLDIKVQKADSPKIVSIEFLDSNGKAPSEPFAYGQTLKARVHCVHMERHTVYATLWEDDAKGAGHNKANEKNKMKTLSGTVKNGIADIDFILVPDFAKIADAIKAEGDADEGKTHEYYVTAEILNKKTASANTNVDNPSYKDTTVKPTVSTKVTPAQKKGPSKKQEKEKSNGDNIIDWCEGLFKVAPMIVPNPTTPTGNNPLKVGEPDKDSKEEKKEEKNGTCVCKDYDLIWGNKVSCDFRKKVIEISKDLWPDKYKTMANGLMAVMKVETSETFSPSKIELVSYIDDNGKKRKKYQGLSKEAINKLGENFSGAVGLIQFTKDAIDALNKENSLNLNKKKLALMTDVEQLEYVKKYFMLYNWHKKLLSPEDIYLQVFAPIGIVKNDNYVLYEKYENPETEKEKISTKNYNANKSVDQENNNDNKIQRVEILGRYRISFAEGLSKKEKEFTCGAVKDKEESNDIGVLDEMKSLVDKHIPYSQLGVRNSLSEKGLKGLDCSETVSIYLTKLGITTNVKELNTGVMTTQKDFRKAIDSENIDFVSGSASKDFKPKRGDVFVWRRLDGVGHTGIVYDFDEKTDLVTILEAIGYIGSADETTNNNNGGYSGKGSSRTAVYKRTGKALLNHAGWKGYFRPKNYTKKL
ncbi:hypothetical protein [Flavobacterium sp. WC2509]|uniref:hypothetical protein n=1 Tax=Flavobacterium sp. WC2509 TaxID=3461406 RepID=UPI004044E41D